MKNKELTMKSRCWRCGEEITSDTDAVEFLYGRWISQLKPMRGISIVCNKCFEEHIIKAFGGLQEIDWD